MILAGAGVVAVATLGAGVRRRRLNRKSLGCVDGEFSSSLSGSTRELQLPEVRAQKARARSQSPTPTQDGLPSRSRPRSSSPTGTGRTARTWKEHAGRTHGGDGYRPCDWTRGHLRFSRAGRARARTPEVLARAEAAAPVPDRVAGVHRDRTQDFKNLGLRIREVQRPAESSNVRLAEAAGAEHTTAQQELAAAYRGSNDHRAELLEALDYLEQALLDAAELEKDKLLDGIAFEEFTEILQEGCREAESALRYFDLARGILESVPVRSPSDKIVKTQMVTHYRMFREGSGKGTISPTKRLHVAERSVEEFVQRHRGGFAVEGPV